ncbi:FimV/HubP family polar landmark protein [Pseudomonas sp. F1_0610]|uniref:FimV/HubP family polar landmark protein n=1 Tax=Pseudomonas sp. F1_0610 TaxID=3114284 RepID=UPI0039C252E0
MLQVRKLVLAIAAVTTFSSSAAFALGLGEIKVHSKLNQPLNAEIELLDTRGLTATEMKPALASPEDFAMAGVDRNYGLTSLRFTPIIKNGKSYVRVTTQKPINEPYLNFLMEMVWPDGKLLREYTLLLDPPNYVPQKIVYAPAVAPSLAPVTVTTASEPLTKQPPQVAPNKTAAEQPAVAANQPRVAPTQPLSKPLPASAVQQQTASKQPSTPAKGQGAQQAGEYKVKKNDTLWDIANEVSGGRNVNQTMLALQDLNPKAFINGNINQLREGYTLRTPSEQEVRSRTRAQAIAEVQNQNSAWRNEPAPKRQLDAGRVAQAGSAPSKVAKPDQLRIEGSSGKGQQGQDRGNTNNAALAAELAQLKESIDSLRLENQELQSRVSDLNSQLTKAQQIAQLKSNQLAQLQESLAKQEQAVKPEAVATQPEEVKQNEDGSEEKPDTNALPAVKPAAPEVSTATVPEVQESPKSEPQPEPKAESKPVYSEPEPFVDDSSFLESLLADPVMMAAVGGGVILLLLVAILARRRLAAKKNANLEEDSTVTAVELPVAAKSAVPAANIIDSPVPDAVDTVLEDADTYIKFGRFPEAIEVLEQAIGKQPKRIDLRNKLAGLYAQTGNKDAFNTQLRELQALNADTEVQFLSVKFAELVEKAPELSDDLLDLEFNVTSPAPAQTSTSTEFDFQEEQAAATQGTDDFDLSSFEAELNDASASLDAGFAELDLTEKPVQPSEPVIEPQAASTEMEFNLDELAQEPEVQVALPELEPETPSTDELLTELDQMLDVADNTVASTTTKDSDFDFSLPEDNFASAAPMDEVAVADEGFAFEEGDDFNMLEGTDMNATKLDLAQAYIDMGDKDGARDILNEVLAEGNDQQKQTAQGLIAKLG